jgi:hypothetical protein
VRERERERERESAEAHFAVKRESERARDGGRERGREGEREIQTPVSAEANFAVNSQHAFQLLKCQYLYSCTSKASKPSSKMRCTLLARHVASERM